MPKINLHYSDRKGTTITIHDPYAVPCIGESVVVMPKPMHGDWIVAAVQHIYTEFDGAYLYHADVFLKEVDQNAS